MSASSRRLWIVALVLVSLGLVVAEWIKVRPWLAAPEASATEIARTWEQVEGWARDSQLANAPKERLQAALAQFKHAKRPPDEGWEPARPPEPVTDEAAQRGIAGLVAWSEQGGGLGDELCIVDPAELAGPPQLVPMFELARLAIRTSPGGDDPGLTAALRLGAYLRARGGLLAGAIGFSIAKEAAEVAAARGQAPGPAFVRFAPRRAEMLPILAREAVCLMRMAEAAFARGESDLGEVATPSNSGWLARWASGRAGSERELAMARWYLGERVAAAARAGEDLAALAASQRLPDDPDALPASLLVRVLAFNASSVIESMDETLAAHAKLVGSQ